MFIGLSTKTEIKKQSDFSNSFDLKHIIVVFVLYLLSYNNKAM